MHEPLFRGENGCSDLSSHRWVSKDLNLYLEMFILSYLLSHLTSFRSKSNSVLFSFFSSCVWYEEIEAPGKWEILHFGCCVKVFLLNS